MPSLIAACRPAGHLAALTQPVLTAGDLTLRPWEPADAPAVAGAYDDPGIRRWHARSMSLDEAAEWVADWPRRWQREADAGWAIAGPTGPRASVAGAAGGEALGQISLRHIDLVEGLASISYWVLPAARGRRLASRSVQVVTRWAFDVLGLHRLDILHSTANEASCRVARRAGYAYEGTLRGQAKHADGWHDMHVHAVVSGDGALAAGPDVTPSPRLPPIRS